MCRNITKSRVIRNTGRSRHWFVECDKINKDVVLHAARLTEELTGREATHTKNPDVEMERFKKPKQIKVVPSQRDLLVCQRFHDHSLAMTLAGFRWIHKGS